MGTKTAHGCRAWKTRTSLEKYNRGLLHHVGQLDVDLGRSRLCVVHEYQVGPVVDVQRDRVQKVLHLRGRQRQITNYHVSHVLVVVLPAPAACLVLISWYRVLHLNHQNIDLQVAVDVTRCLDPRQCEKPTLAFDYKTLPALDLMRGAVMYR